MRMIHCVYGENDVNETLSITNIPKSKGETISQA